MLAGTTASDATSPSATVTPHTFDILHPLAIQSPNYPHVLRETIIVWCGGDISERIKISINYSWTFLRSIVIYSSTYFHAVEGLFCRYVDNTFEASEDANVFPMLSISFKEDSHSKFSMKDELRITKT